MLSDGVWRKRIRSGPVGLAGVLALSLLLAGCSQPPKINKVGILCGFDSFIKIVDGFKAEMTALGHVEGRNITYNVQSRNADPAGMQSVAGEFVAGKVDLILAFPTEAAVAAKAASQGTGVPVVFANSNIEGSNLVESVRRPGGNITGVCTLLAEHTVKRLEIFHELAPRVKRIYAPYDAEYPGLAGILDMLRPAAAAANISLVETPVKTLDEIRADLKARAARGDIGMDAVMILPTRLPVSAEGFRLLNEFAAEHKLPVAGSQPFMADQGAVLSFALDHFSVGRQAAPLADKILKGTPAGTIPVVSAELFLRINYRRARELGLAVSEGLLKMANEVIR